MFGNKKRSNGGSFASAFGGGNGGFDTFNVLGAGSDSGVYVRSGNMTTGPSGTYFSTGNFTAGPDGTYFTSGNTTFGPSGTYFRNGNMMYGPDGAHYIQDGPGGGFVF